MRIRSASLIFSFAISCVSILAISIFALFSYLRLINQTSENSLVEFASFIAADLAKADDLTRAVQNLTQTHSEYSRTSIQREIYNVTKNTTENRIYVTDSNGMLLFKNGSKEQLGENWAAWKDIAAALKGKYGARTTREGGTYTLYSSVPVIKDGRLMAVVSVAHSNKDMLGYAISATKRLGTAVIAVIAVSLVAALIFSHFISSPLKRLNAYILGLKSNRAVVIPDSSVSEVQDLTRSFNELHSELGGKQYVEKALQAISHEIRSPVTAIRAASELLDQNSPDNSKLIANISQQSTRIESLISDLLDLSKIKNLKDESRKLKTKLDDFWRDLLEDCSKLSNPGGIIPENRVASECFICIDSFLLRRAILILVDNAQKFSAPNDQIKLEASCSQTEVAFTVQDRGCGIPEWAESKIFDEFFSLPGPDNQKKGSGIGLALAKQIALYHSSRLEVFNSKKLNESERGVIARVVVPLIAKN